MGEGVLVASVAEAHPRPAPYVFRANELLADMGWASPTYRLHADTVELVSHEVSEIQPAFLVLDYVANRPPVPHNELLRALVRKSPEVYSRVYSKTSLTDFGMETVDLYRATQAAGAKPNLDRVYQHLQKSLSSFHELNK